MEQPVTITPVILSGGGGTRLWPMSTPVSPKQFLALTGVHTMFQLTAMRVRDRTRFTAPIVVANVAHAQIVEEQLAAVGINDAILLLEPCARNTAPAIALAALACPDAETAMLVMPSDHVIADLAAFDAATDALLPLVENGWLATYGISPTAPETGYGYIQLDAAQAPGVHAVRRFVEKPDIARATEMIAGGDHVWNGGIFLFRADNFLEALSAHAPDMLAAAKSSMALATMQGHRIYPQLAAFEQCPSDSIDYAVMEKADRVAVAPVSMGWSDVGSWDSLHEIRDKDGDDNALSGAVRIDASTGNLVHADGIRISLHGVNDLIVVANGTEVMILPRGKSQKVRDFAKD
ncbi:mannose-1-phosphate guanyltransferase [Sphingorhabdus sp. IMCC26285]|uniref:Mannose-1-phosphate guanyltransferase n=1 Tax=Sphingorhabdus profundilacus TaxID=2509718 RepID=A0A6I4M334_9SPHN|nr:sugar phosphate nucleotidyltransferase [Sphingorhabdus profundilacus]MVZ96878.1 mannose-1-phosphate guanyltransferase [Sphingorhabdus profundilacus]